MTTKMNNNEERRLKNALGRAERTQNSQTAPPTGIRILVPKKTLISRGQRIKGDQRHVFLWTVKTLHGANLNNQCTKKTYYAVSQSK